MNEPAWTTVSEQPPTRGGAIATPLLVCLAFCAVVVPQIPRTQFFNTPENLNIGTALEIRRTGSWWMPTLEGNSRLNKPPMAPWITALCIDSGTLTRIASPDPVVRHRAFAWLSLEARLSAVLLSCLMIWCVFEIGRTLQGQRLGTAAALVCASSILTLWQGHLSTYDIHLAGWVSLANLLGIKAIWGEQTNRGRRIFVLGLLAGLCSGLGMMSKGPAAVLTTIVPICMFAVWRQVAGAGRVRWGLLLLAWSLAFLAVITPWFGDVVRRDPQIWRGWFVEVARLDRAGSGDPWYKYVTLIGFLWPWSVFLVVGAIVCVGQAIRRQLDGAVLCATMLLVPVVVLSCLSQKEDRFLLPVMGPAALVTAYGLLEWQQQRPERKRAGRTIAAMHWGVVCVGAVGLPLVAASGLVEELRTVDHKPWFSVPIAITLAAVGLAVMLAGVLVRRRSAAVLATFALGLIATGLVFWDGYRRSERGTSQALALADKVWERCPTAITLNGHRKPGKRASVDFSIYVARSTPWISAGELAALRPGDRPRVVLLGKPGEAPPGWIQIGEIPLGKDSWYGFMLPARLP